MPELQRTVRLTHGSLFSGIGGFDLGFERAGFKTIWQVEQEPFCRAVLKTRFPKAKLFSDVKEVGAENLKTVGCITAGVPCQDVSVAGKRAGLAGERTGLFYEFARILRELRPAWFVFENVPGLFSSNRGRDFAEVLRVLMVECGYGVCWRVLDSQFFGVAQRRRRLFIVGRFGKPCPAAVLFERESGAGNPAEGGKTGQDVAFALATSVRGTGDGHGNAWNSNYVARRLTQSTFKRHDEANIVAGPVKGASLSRRTVNSEEAASGFLVAATLRESDGHHGRSSPRGDGCDNLIAAPLSAGSSDKSHVPGRRREDDFNFVATINSGGNADGFRTEPGEHIVIQDVRGGTRDQTNRGHGIGIREGGPCDILGAVERHDIAYSLQRNERNTSQGPGNYVSARMSVRRLTPSECETLQGFPKGWTIPDGISKEANTAKALHPVRGKDGAQARTRRRFGEPVSLQQEKILRRELLGDVGEGAEQKSRCQAASRALPSSAGEAEDAMRDMRLKAECGPSSQRRESAEQSTREYSEPLPTMPHDGTRPKPDSGNRQRSEGCQDQGWPLLPKGLDSSRYRALGNAVTVAVAEWIARKIIQESGPRSQEPE